MNAIFIFGNCEKKDTVDIYMPCVFISIIFITKMYSYYLPWKRLVSFRKIVSAQHLKGIYEVFLKKKLLFIICSVLSEMCQQVFFSFNVSNLEILNVYILCYVLGTNLFDLYSFILNFFFCPDCLG